MKLRSQTNLSLSEDDLKRLDIVRMKLNMTKVDVMRKGIEVCEKEIKG